MLKEQKVTSKLQSTKIKAGKNLSRNILRKLDKHLVSSPPSLDPTLNTDNIHDNVNSVNNPQLIDCEDISDDDVNICTAQINVLNNVHVNNQLNNVQENNQLNNVQENLTNKDNVARTLESNEFRVRHNSSNGDPSYIYRVNSSLLQSEKASVDSPLILVPTGETEIITIANTPVENKYVGTSQILLKDEEVKCDQSFYNRPGQSQARSELNFSDQFAVARPCSSHQKVVWFVDTYFSKMWDYENKADAYTSEIHTPTVKTVNNDSNLYTLFVSIFSVLLITFIFLLSSMFLEESSDYSYFLIFSLFTILSSIAGSLTKTTCSYLLHYWLALWGLVLYYVLEKLEKYIDLVLLIIKNELKRRNQWKKLKRDMDEWEKQLKIYMTFKNIYILKYPAWISTWGLYKHNRISFYQGVLNLSVKFYKMIFYFVPLISQPIEKHDLQNIHLKNIPKKFTYSNYQKKKVKKLKNYLRPGENQLSCFIPLYVRNGLPFVTASFEKSGHPIRLLIDTGCKFNILNIKDLESIEVSRGCELPKFSHNLQLQGHSGKPVRLSPNGVLVPLSFETETPDEYVAINIPFLIENVEMSINILGYEYIQELFIHFSSGYNFLELSVPKNLRLPEEWKPITESFYQGTLRSAMSSDMKKDIQFSLPGFEEYTGCIFLSHIELNYREKMVIHWSVVAHLNHGILITEDEEFIELVHNYGYLKFLAVAFPCQDCNQRGHGIFPSEATDGKPIRNELNQDIHHFDADIKYASNLWDKFSDFIEFMSTHVSEQESQRHLQDNRPDTSHDGFNLNKMFENDSDIDQNCDDSLIDIDLNMFEEINVIKRDNDCTNIDYDEITDVIESKLPKPLCPDNISRINNQYDKSRLNNNDNIDYVISQNEIQVQKTTVSGSKEDSEIKIKVNIPIKDITETLGNINDIDTSDEGTIKRDLNINEYEYSSNFSEFNIGIYDHDNDLESVIVEPMNHPMYIDVQPEQEKCLEIQIRDLAGRCLICALECFCTKNKKAIINVKKRGFHLKYGNNYNDTLKRYFYKRGEVVFLIIEFISELKYHLGFLSEIIFHLIAQSKKYEAFRLGNIIHLNHSNKMITCHLLRYFENCGWPPGSHFFRTFQSEDTVASVGHLEYNQDEGIHVGCPLMENLTVGLPVDIGVQGEVKYIHDESDVHQNDIADLLKESNPDYFHIMEKALDIFPEVTIKSLDDFGAILHPAFKLEIKLTDNSLGALPRHKPFPCSSHYSQVVDKLVNYWCKIELAEHSNNKDWASRLLIIRKKISDRQYKTIRAEVEANTSYKFTSNETDELYSIDSEHLSIKSLQAIYRVVLDSRDLNRITCPLLGISQNPETTLFNIMCNMNNLSQHKLENITLESLRASDPYRDETEHLNPRVSDEMIAHLSKMIHDLPDHKDQKYFYSSIDISSAHTSVKLTDEASQLLNFITPSLMLFRFRRSAFGLKGISTQFNTILIKILYDLVQMALIVIYADDILVASMSKRTHIIIVITILERFARHGIRISINKCTIGVKKFRYIGFLFAEDGITLSPERISALTHFPSPSDRKGVMRLVGMLNFISKWIPQYSFHLLPITELLKGDDFYWGPAQQEAFDNIKKIISSNLKLNYVPHDETLTLFVDSSGVAGGAVLFAGQAGTESYRPILYMSKKYDSVTTKTNSALEAECLNLIYSLEKIKFFTSLPRKIKVVTDAKSIIFLLFGSRKTKNAKLARFAGKISEYLVDFEISYSPPTIPEMQIADCLSRQHSKIDSCYPSNICKAITKNDISLPKEGIYSLEELENIVDHQSLVKIPADFVIDPDHDANCPEINIHGEDQTIPGLEFAHNILTLSSTQELSDENIIQEQAKDSYLKQIIEDFPVINSLNDTEHKMYIIKKGILYIIQDDLYKLYIPDSLLTTLVGAAHIMLGHRGEKSLIQMMELKYYHDSLRKCIRNLVKSCHLCLLCSPDSRKKAPIDGFKVCTYPNEVWSIDYFKMEKFNNWQYILIIVDLFSGYTILHKAKSETACSTVEGLKRAFLHLAIPKEIRSDQAQNLLNSKEVAKLLQKFNISQYRFPSYYSRHNPKVERYVRTIRSLFKFYKASNDPLKGFDWPSILEEINILLNAIPRKLIANGTSRYISSFEMYFNRKSDFLSLPADPSQFQDIKAGPNNTEEIQLFVTQAITNLKNEYATAHNKKSRDDIIQPGDFFLIKDKSTPKQGEIAIKNRTLYKRKVYICKQILGRALVGESLWDGSVIFANLDNIKVYLSRSAYFSDLPPEIKQHVGSEFNATIDMRVRKSLLEKLKHLNMFSRERKDPIIDYVSDHSVTSQSIEDQVSDAGLAEPMTSPKPISATDNIRVQGEASHPNSNKPISNPVVTNFDSNQSTFSELTRAITLSKSDLVQNDEHRAGTVEPEEQVEQKLDTISEESNDYDAPSDITQQLKRAGENIIKVTRPQRIKTLPKKFKDHVLSWAPGSNKS